MYSVVIVIVVIAIFDVVHGLIHEINDLVHLVHGIVQVLVIPVGAIRVLAVRFGGGHLGIVANGGRGGDVFVAGSRSGVAAVVVVFDIGLMREIWRGGECQSDDEKQFLLHPAEVSCGMTDFTRIWLI